MDTEQIETDKAWFYENKICSAEFVSVICKKIWKN